MRKSKLVDKKIKSRVFIIGFDGATFNVIRPMLASGKLPNLQKIINDGAHGILNSTLPAHSCPAWTSLATGVHPGTHGIYGFFNRQKGKYSYPTVNSNQIQSPTMWKILSAQNYKIGVVNVPVTYPPMSVNGVMISGMLSPDMKSAFHPQSLYSEIKKAVPNYQVEVRSPEKNEEYLEEAFQNIQRRTALFKHLVDSNDFDFFMNVYTELDRIQHFYWAAMDLKNPMHSKNLPEAMKNGIEQTYKALDHSLHDVFERMTDDDLLLIVSDHGFEGVYKLFRVNQWLEKNGYLKKKIGFGKMIVKIKKMLIRMGLQTFFRKVQKRVPIAKQHDVSNLPFVRDINWKKTKAIYGPNMGININRKGEYPQGIVSDKDYESLCDEIIAKLKKTTDLDGFSPFEAIYKREEIHSGQALNLAPDIRIVLGRRPDGSGKYQLNSEFSGDIFAYSPRIHASHKKEGVIFAYGKNVKSGAKIENAGIWDILPTVFSHLGAKIPNHVEGETISEMFEKENSLKFYDYQSQISEKSEEEMNSEQAKKIENRLRELGYLED
ncbi:alkaline phosphatase family protein [bacterium]|nr:alkaline phosphatase family protein [bacterium]